MKNELETNDEVIARQEKVIAGRTREKWRPSKATSDEVPADWGLEDTDVAIVSDSFSLIAVIPDIESGQRRDGLISSSELKASIRKKLANISLIVAAPELLEAGKALRDWCDANLNGSPLEYSKIITALDSAIAKAEGK